MRLSTQALQRHDAKYLSKEDLGVDVKTSGMPSPSPAAVTALFSPISAMGRTHGNCHGNGPSSGPDQLLQPLPRRPPAAAAMVDMANAAWQPVAAPWAVTANDRRDNPGLGFIALCFGDHCGRTVSTR